VSTNIFKADVPEFEISKLLALIGQPARIKILLVISSQEACVCHMEAVTGMRQASISQHLMALRKAGLVTSSRTGRNIFYRLARPEVLGILDQSALLVGISPDQLKSLSNQKAPGCTCPQCAPDLDPKLCCKPDQPCVQDD
jgi:DNA-binding transcriptional ArsR family regulator